MTKKVLNFLNLMKKWKIILLTNSTNWEWFKQSLTKKSLSKGCKLAQFYTRSTKIWRDFKISLRYKQNMPKASRFSQKNKVKA